MTDLTATEKFAIALRVRAAREPVDETRETFLSRLEGLSDKGLEKEIVELERAAQREQAAEQERAREEAERAAAEAALRAEERREAFRTEIKSIVSEVLEERGEG